MYDVCMFTRGSQAFGSQITVSVDEREDICVVTSANYLSETNGILLEINGEL